MTLKIASMPDGTSKDVHLKAWKRDSVDTRDYKLKTLQATELPQTVDNSHWCSLPEDQGNLGSCTAHAVVGALEYNDRRFNSKPTNRRISRLFQYYATRVIENTVNEDSGASIRNAIKSAATYGSIKESRWWYDIAKFTVLPPKRIWTDAATDKVTSYYRIDDGDLDTMKKTLSHGYLIVFGMAVFNDMITSETAASGVLKLPSHDEECIGGHAVAIVGYDDSKRMFKVRNSWGRDWGQHGYFWMPYDYVGNTDLCNDFWVIVSAVIV